MVEAKRSTRHGVACVILCSTAGLESGIVEQDGHILGFDAPTWGECPFDSAAECPRGGGVAACGRNGPVAASIGSARIDDRTASWDESDAALDVEESAVPGISQPAGHHGKTPDLVKIRALTAGVLSR